jgi:N-acetylmuramoyl-L-alanine amidase
MLTISCISCGRRAEGGDAGEADGTELSRAAQLAAGGALPGRAEALALAQSIEARAIREGASARASSLHATAARIVERVWRLEARDQDAKEATDLYRAAAQNVTWPGACEAAVQGARLAGDIARDASATYAELYKVQRRVAAASGADAGAGPCAASLDASLGILAAFRPPARVLAAIDEGLAGEGALAATRPDAGPRVLVAPQIVRIDEWPGEESARVVVTLDREAPFRVADDTQSARLPRTSLELDGVDVGSAPRDVRMGGLVTRVRAESTTTGARVTLDLSGPKAYRRVFHLLEPFRVVLDVARNPPGVSAQTGPLRSASRVVLDPGHGGNDPGAIGASGVREKDVTLDVAHRVAPILAKQGLVVTLTRDDDRYVTLEERTARANGFNADLFVSIHCNAAENRARHGVETYVLDTTKDEIAARVAARENATSQAATAELGSLLASMRMADQATRSTKLAELLQRATMASLHPEFPDALDGGVHTAGFYVLVGARMPSVLFETSYISNGAEESRLASEQYKQRLADGIVNAVKAYREGR